MSTEDSVESRSIQQTTTHRTYIHILCPFFQINTSWTISNIKLNYQVFLQEHVFRRFKEALQKKQLSYPGPPSQKDKRFRQEKVQHDEDLNIHEIGQTKRE